MKINMGVSLKILKIQFAPQNKFLIILNNLVKIKGIVQTIIQIVLFQILFQS
jgi:hypothetical protein